MSSKILVVDDEKEIRNLIEIYLKNEGYTVLKASNGEEALEVLAKEEVEEKYVRDFLNCSIIDRNSKNFEIDKIMLIYKYGSKKARKIAVDEKLKMI